MSIGTSRKPHTEQFLKAGAMVVVVGPFRKSLLLCTAPAIMYRPCYYAPPLLILLCTAPAIIIMPGPRYYVFMLHNSGGSHPKLSFFAVASNCSYFARCTVLVGKCLLAQFKLIGELVNNFSAKGV